MPDKKNVESSKESFKEITEEIKRVHENVITKQISSKILYIIDNYCLSYDAHKLAYEKNKQYKIFYDNLPDKIQKRSKVARGVDAASSTYLATAKGLINIYTLGAPTLVRKLMGKKSKRQLLKEEVASKDFTALLKTYNTVITKKSYNTKE